MACPACEQISQQIEALLKRPLGRGEVMLVACKECGDAYVVTATGSRPADENERAVIQHNMRTAEELRRSIKMARKAGLN